MKLTYIRWIDKYGGLLLCYIICIKEHILCLYRCFSRKKLRERPIKKILIIKFWGFGSVVLASAAFQALRYNFPHCYLSVFTLTQNRPVYDMLGFFDEIFDADLQSVPVFLFKVWNYLRYIRKSGFDIVFDLEFTSRFSAIITYLSNAPRRFGFKYQSVWRGNCYTNEVEFREDKKITHSFLDLMKMISKNLSVPTSPATLNIKIKDQEYIDTLFGQEHIMPDRPVVGVNINASKLCLLRRWPQDYFIVLVKELIERYSAHVIFIGDKEDIGYVDETIAKFPFKENIHNFAGRTSLSQLAYLLSKLKLFISNDSGPLHLAAYIKIPTISFFGPETPLIYGPQGIFDVIFYKKTDCSPCIRIKNYKHYNCVNNHRCLREIKPSEVISEIERKRIL